MPPKPQEERLRDIEALRTRVAELERQAVERAQANEAALRMAAVVESSDDAIIGETLDGTITAWNSGAEKIFGYSAAEVMGRSVFILIPPERAKELPRVLERILREERVDLETVRVRKDGARIDVSVTISRIRDAAGNITGLSAIGRDITRHKRVEKAARTLANMSRLISQSLDPEEVGRRIADGARESLGSVAAVLSALEPASGDLRTLAISGNVGPDFDRDVIFPLDNGCPGLAVRERRAVVTSDVLADPRIRFTHELRGRIERSPMRAMLSVPLLVEDTVIGSLCIADRAGRVFEEEEIHLVEAFADQAAIVIRNAQMFAERETSRAQAEASKNRFETLARLAQAVTSSLEFHEVLDSVVRMAVDLLPDSSARIWVVEGDRLVLRSEAGTLGPPRSGRKTAFAFGEGLTGWVATKRESLVVEDVLADPRTVNVEWMRQERYVSLVSVPLSIRDRLVGVLTLLTRHRHHFSTEELEILTSFGTQAAIAINNTRLFEEAERRRLAAESLAEVGRLLSQSLDLSQVGQRIADSVRALLRAKSSVLFRLEPESEDLVAVAVSGDVGPTFGRNIVFPKGTGVMSLAIQARQAVITPDLLTDPRVTLPPEARARIEQAPFRATLAVPLTLMERVIGALSVGDVAGRVFSSDEIHLAQAFADQAATALENARLYWEAQEAYEEIKQTQEQLSQSQKMEAIGRLAGGIAHDFNNLLTVITGRAELALTRLGPEDPLCRDIELIRKTTERAAGLVRQILAFSRKQVLQPQVLDLNALVANIGAMLRRLIGEDIELVTMSAPDLGRVRVDPGQLEQVILNLAVNARDAMPQGGRLAIEMANVYLDEAYASRHVAVEPGHYVMLAVSDTGCGMDAETLSHAFEPFFTTKERGKGTGLGLSTVYGIVKQSGGNIWVYSEPGHGTTFKIYLPRVDEGVEALERSPASARSVPGSETILLVEDEAELREIAREVLQMNGYTVLVAGHGADGLSVSERHAGPIHLLLTDVVMPQMSGPALADRLAPLRPEMKVLYMSGYADQAIVHHGVLDQGTALLQKPFTPDDLARKVREILDAPLRR